MIAALQERIASFEDRPAIISPQGTYTYRQLVEKVKDIGGLLAGGRCVNRVVALIGDYSFVSIAALIALWDAGNIVALMTGRSAGEVDQLMAIAGANAVVRPNGDDADLLLLDRPVSHPLLEALFREGSGGYIIFSSGSTGTPKASVHRIGPLIEKNSFRGQPLRTISFLLFDHIGGLNTLIRTVMNGGSLVVLDDRSPGTVAQSVERHRVQALITSPSFLNLLLVSGAADAHDLSSLEILNYGTEPMPQSTLQALNRHLPQARLTQSYGTTETGVVPTRSESSSSNRLSIRAAQCDFRVVDGLLEVRASTAMVGYLNSEDRFTADGYFRTGDAVIQNGEFLYIVGRQSESINVGGEKFYPAEIEDVLIEMPGVIDVVVVKDQNALVGNIVTAVFQVDALEPDVEFRRRVNAFSRERLSRPRIPQKIRQTTDPLHGSRFKKIRTQPKEAQVETLRAEFARLLEVVPSEVTDDVELDTFPTWDSLSQVSVVAFAVGEGKADPNINALAKAATFKELAEVLGFSTTGRS